MSQSSSDAGERAELIDTAQVIVESGGYRVLDREWSCGQHRLALVAAARDRVLIAVEVHGPDDERYDYVTGMAEDRVRQLRAAAAAWMNAHGGRFTEIRVDLVEFIAGGTTANCAEHIEGVG